jgi:hypothetical protein
VEEVENDIILDYDKYHRKHFNPVPKKLLHYIVRYLTLFTILHIFLPKQIYLAILILKICFITKSA